MNPEAMNRFVADFTPAFTRGDGALEHKREEQANVVAVRALFDALRQQDAAGVARIMAEDVELEITGPPTLPLAGSWKGRDEVLAAAGRNFAMLEDQKPEILSLVAQGDSVVLVGREQGRLKSTGREYDIRWLQHFTLRDGRIVKVLEFCDNPAAFSDG